MERLHNYEISFSSLKLGSHSFTMNIEQSFFDFFNFNQEFSSPKIEVNTILIKHSSFLELEISIKGTLILKCDISDEDYEQNVSHKVKTLVKFGEEYDDSNEEILIIPLGAHSVNISQLIFECVILSIPMKHIHPRYYVEGYEDEYTKLLKKYALPDEDEGIEN